MLVLLSNKMEVAIVEVANARVVEYVASKEDFTELDNNVSKSWCGLKIPLLTKSGGNILNLGDVRPSGALLPLGGSI